MRHCVTCNRLCIYDKIKTIVTVSEGACLCMKLCLRLSRKAQALFEAGWVRKFHALTVFLTPELIETYPPRIFILKLSGYRPFDNKLGLAVRLKALMLMKSGKVHGNRRDPVQPSSRSTKSGPCSSDATNGAGCASGCFSSRRRPCR